MAYGTDLTDLSQRGGLHRSDPRGSQARRTAQLPTKLELVVNLRSAKAVGLTIPPSLLGRADQVIKCEAKEVSRRGSKARRQYRKA
jgi:putative ABC transport system substrate-binding protein